MKTLAEAIREIESLIHRLGKELSPNDYLEALSEMSERSTDAYNAFQEVGNESD
jgi:hypothetical protein